MRRVITVMLSVAVVVGLAGCGGDDDTPTTKAGWEKENKDLFDDYGRTLADTRASLNGGERSSTLRACNQLTEDATAVKEDSLPVPNPAVDGPLRASVEKALVGARNCLEGGRSSAEAGARQVEQAMRDLTEASDSLDDANSALGAW